MNPNPNENPNPAASGPAPAVHIYADGACSGNPGPGGWGAVLMCPEQGLEKRMSGAAAGTTNNRMELTAVIQGLMALKRPCRVTVTTDSRYVVDAFEKNWLAKWQRNGWRTAGRQPVKNEDLWRELLEAMSTHRVSWRWIRGHAGHPENELADRLAVAARQGGSGAMPAGKPASGRKSPCGKGKGRPGGKPKRPGRGLPA